MKTLDNLALFTSCQNSGVTDVLTALEGANIKANSVLVVAPDATACTSYLPDLQKIGPVSFARLVVDGDPDWAACGGTKAAGTVDSVIKCYHDRISAASARPAGTSFAGIGWTDEGEGKFACGGASNAPVNTVVAGPWSRLYPKEVRAQVASGPQAQFCAMDPTTTLASACTTPQYCYSTPNVGPTDWFPEGTYEPYKLKADPAGGCAKYAGQLTTCCDGSTKCPMIKQTPCAMTDPDGWAKAALAILPPPTSGVNKYVTMGVADSNADCGFGGTSGAKNAATATLALAAGGSKDVVLYTRA